MTSRRTLKSAVCSSALLPIFQVLADFLDDFYVEFLRGFHQMASTANDYTNSQEIEAMWAIKAFEHAETYYDLISVLDCSKLSFTSCDDKIYEKFRTEMKDFEVHAINGDKLKTRESKELWRPFCEDFKGIVEEYNFGTLLRLDALKEPSEDNTILVPRVQFWAIEIARNREGINKKLLRKNKDKFNAKGMESLNIDEQTDL